MLRAHTTPSWRPCWLRAAMTRRITDLGTPPGNSAFTDTGTGDAEDNEARRCPTSMATPLCRMWSKASTTTVTTPSGSSPQRRATKMTIENYPNFGGATGQDWSRCRRGQLRHLRCLPAQTGCTPR